MTESRSAEYLRARAERERQAAGRAASPAIAAIHMEMANRYEAELNSIEPGAMALIDETQAA